MCYCDYEGPEFYHSDKRIARKRHRCTECGCRIELGEQYEHVWGKWDGDVSFHKTCLRCVELSRFVADKSDCNCIAHGRLIEDCLDIAQEHGHDVPGLLFGARRRQALIYRHNKQSLAR